MKKLIYLLIMFVLMTSSLAVTTINKSQYLNIDFDNVNLNVDKVGVVWYYDSEFDFYEVEYVIEHDLVRKVDSDNFEVYTNSISYFIDLDYFILCSNEKSVSECKSELILDARDYFKNELKNYRIIMGNEQDRERASLSKVDAVSSLLDLDVGVLE